MKKAIVTVMMTLAMVIGMSFTLMANSNDEVTANPEIRVVMARDGKNEIIGTKYEFVKDGNMYLNITTNSDVDYVWTQYRGKYVRAVLQKNYEETGLKKWELILKDSKIQDLIGIEISANKEYAKAGAHNIRTYLITESNTIGGSHLLYNNRYGEIAYGILYSFQRTTRIGTYYSGVNGIISGPGTNWVAVKLAIQSVSGTAIKEVKVDGENNPDIYTYKDEFNAEVELRVYDYENDTDKELFRQLKVTVIDVDGNIYTAVIKAPLFPDDLKFTITPDGVLIMK